MKTYLAWLDFILGWVVFLRFGRVMGNVAFTTFANLLRLSLRHDCFSAPTRQGIKSDSEKIYEKG